MSGLRNKIYFLYRAKLFPHCKGVYETYEQAKCVCKVGYNDQEFAEVITNCAKVKLDKPDIVEEIDFYTSRYFIPLLCRKTFKQENIHIVDFGGAAADAYFLLKSFLKKVDFRENIRFTIVETEELSKCAQEALGNEELNFISFSEFKKQMDSRTISADVFMASSSLQYTDDPTAFLLQIAEQRLFKYIWITRTPMLSDKRQFSSIQRADYGKLMGIRLSKVMDYVITFMEIDKVEHIFEKNGYNYVLKMKDKQHLGAPDVIVEYYSLLFSGTDELC